MRRASQRSGWSAGAAVLVVSALLAAGCEGNEPRRPRDATPPTPPDAADAAAADAPAAAPDVPDTGVGVADGGNAGDAAREAAPPDAGDGPAGSDRDGPPAPADTGTAGDQRPDGVVADARPDGPGAGDAAGSPEGVPTRTCLAIGLGAVRAIAYLPDGSRLVAGTAASIAKLFRASDGAELRAFIGHEAALTAVAVSDDGALLATASLDRTARLWRIADGAPIATLTGHGTAIHSVAISPDGATVATGSADGEVRLWATVGGAPVRTAQPHVDRVVGLAYLSDGLIASAGREGEVEVWSVADGALVRQLYKGTMSFSALALSRDRTLVAAGGADSTVRVWRAATGEAVRTANPPYSVVRLAFSGDGTRLYSISGTSSIYVHSLADATVRSFASSLWTSQGLAVSPDGETIVLGNDFGELLLHAPDGKQKAEIIPGLTQVRDLSFFAGGGQLLIGGSAPLRPGVQIRRVSDGALVRALDAGTGTLTAVAATRDGSLLAAGGDDGSVVIWPSPTAMLPRHVYDFSVRAEGLAFLPGNEWLVAVGSSDVPRMIRTATGESPFALPGVNGYVESLAVSDDGTLIAAGGDIRRVGIWRAADRSTVHILEEAHSLVARGLAFSPDNAMLATTGDARVRLWSVATGAPLAQLTGMTFSGQAVDFTPDGAFVAGAGDDGVVRIWRVADRQLVAALRGHSERISTVAFSPDGRSLATGSNDGTARLWCRP